MKKTTILTLISVITTLACFGQQQTAKVGTVVPYVEVRDSRNNPVSLPYFGDKHLLIFYVDPDHGNQNKQFTDYLEEHQIISDHIFSFGIINLKDAPLLPNGVVRTMIRNKEKKVDAPIYTDPSHLLRDAWGLGDVNNLFTIIFVNSDREIVFLKKGKLSEKDKEEFFEVINRHM